MGSARLWRAVFGVAPKTLVPNHPTRRFMGEKFVSRSRRRDGDDCTRDACAPQRTESFRFRAAIIALVCTALLLLTSALNAQTLTVLHSFTDSDGAFPYAGLILQDNTLYGTTALGGASDGGTVFALNTDGTGFAVLHSFSGFGDGVAPEAGLILSGGSLYGTATGGGSAGYGTVFAVNTDSTAFTTLHSFTGGNGNLRLSTAGLIISDNSLYGTAPLGGSSGSGTLFKVNIDGTGFTTLHNFARAPDGANPQAGLILSGNTLYGTAAGGGSSSNGTVFRVSIDGTAFTNLHSFTATSGPDPSTNSDGAEPYAGLILSGNTLYGTTYGGGIGGNGTVFALNTDGTGFTTLHNFAGPGDGANPQAGLILSGNILYGTATGGGSAGSGTVFKLNTDGSGFTNLYSFTDGSDGGDPSAGLILSGSSLYGTAQCGGNSGEGTLFRLSLPVTAPQLAVIPAGANVILTWPTDAAGFALQSTTNLGSPALWTAVSPDPVAANGRNIVTNSISGAQQFYRLAQ
jgi:uncharacterized repeat protein (TIGR03803 family)